MASLRRRIQEHQSKIALEQVQPEAKNGLIRHWESEIRAFAIQLHRLEDRLIQRRRRGR